MNLWQLSFTGRELRSSGLNLLESARFISQLLHENKGKEEWAPIHFAPVWHWLWTTPLGKCFWTFLVKNTLWWAEILGDLWDPERYAVCADVILGSHSRGRTSRVYTTSCLQGVSQTAIAVIGVLTSNLHLRFSPYSKSLFFFGGRPFKGLLISQISMNFGRVHELQSPSALLP